MPAMEVRTMEVRTMEVFYPTVTFKALAPSPTLRGSD